ncbi:MAG: hypothetical protein RLZZ265_1033 [Verrucomicrobiota bacterium]
MLAGQWALLGPIVFLENTDKDWLAWLLFLLGTLLPFVGYVFLCYKLSFIASFKWQVVRFLIIAFAAFHLVLNGAMALFVLLFVFGVPVRG